MKITIVGAGLSGLTAAALLRKNNQIEIFETLGHIGGNCYDFENNGVLIHKYGPHIFHTNDKSVWAFINQFAKFTDYKHIVNAETDIGAFTIPFSKFSAMQIGRDLSNDEIVKYVFQKYSQKMWGVSWEYLPKSITGRVLIRRNNFDPYWFTDKFEGVPIGGYTQLLNNMADNKNIKIHYACKDDDWKKSSADLVIYTGRIDKYFDYRFGKLSYRSLKIKFFSDNKSTNSTQTNNCTDKKHTRIINYNLFYEYNKKVYYKSIEEPIDCGDEDMPYYPANFGKNVNLLKRYKTLPLKNTILCGRLGLNKYLNMDDAIKNAMQILKGLL